MKTLLIIRHAKSSWASIGQQDFDRPLNARGERDAPEMADKIFDKQIVIDKFISSPAKRAKATCKAFTKKYSIEKSEILFIDKLYHAPSPVFYEVISGLDDSLTTVAIFAHNPGISEFADSLCEDVAVFDMPTCAVFAVKIDVTSWKEFKTAEKEFLFFEKP
jgi:phosphohistidine phosphatase